MSERLRAMRIGANKSVRETAEFFGITPVEYSKLERGVPDTALEGGHGTTARPASHQETHLARRSHVEELMERRRPLLGELDALEDRFADTQSIDDWRAAFLKHNELLELDDELLRIAGDEEATEDVDREIMSAGPESWRALPDALKREVLTALRENGVRLGRPSSEERR